MVFPRTVAGCVLHLQHWCRPSSGVDGVRRQPACCPCTDACMGSPALLRAAPSTCCTAYGRHAASRWSWRQAQPSCPRRASHPCSDHHDITRPADDTRLGSARTDVGQGRLRFARRLRASMPPQGYFPPAFYTASLKPPANCIQATVIKRTHNQTAM